MRAESKMALEAAAEEQVRAVEEAVEAARQAWLADSSLAVEASNLKRKLQIAADREKALRERVTVLEAEVQMAAAAAAASESERFREEALLHEQMASMAAAAPEPAPVSRGGEGVVSMSGPAEAAGPVDDIASPSFRQVLGKLFSCSPAISGGRHSLLRVPRDEPDADLEPLDVEHAESGPRTLEFTPVAPNPFASGCADRP